MNCETSNHIIFNLKFTTIRANDLNHNNYDNNNYIIIKKSDIFN